MKFLIVVILLIIIFPYLLRLLLPWMLKRSVERMQRQAYGSSNAYQQKGKEGSVKVDSSGNASTATKPKKKVSKNVGDYVDFEEVK